MSVIVIECSHWEMASSSDAIRQVGYGGKVARLWHPGSLIEGFSSGIILTEDAVDTCVALLQAGIPIRFVGKIRDHVLIVLDDVFRLVEAYRRELDGEIVFSPRLKPYGGTLAEKALNQVSAIISQRSNV